MSKLVLFTNLDCVNDFFQPTTIAEQTHRQKEKEEASYAIDDSVEGG